MSAPLNRDGVEEAGLFSRFLEGRQPCVVFEPEIEGNGYGSWENVHECFGPYPRQPGQSTCAGRVSFCANCTTDHHSNGWDTCPTPSKNVERPTP